MIARPILRPIPCFLAVWSKTASLTGNTIPAISLAFLYTGHGSRSPFHGDSPRNDNNRAIKTPGGVPPVRDGRGSRPTRYLQELKSG